MDDVFRALNDPHRREILDSLRQCDGQTLSKLEELFPELTRFAVMKHVRILEQANLLSTQKVGRSRYHYLNPVPIQEVANRWISRFSKPWVESMLNIKTELETNTMLLKPQHKYVTIIKTTAEKLWEALTDGKITPAYYYGGTFVGNLKVGSDYYYKSPGDGLFVKGRILEMDPPKKLVCSFQGMWHPEMQQDAPSRVTWEILPQGECCRLTLLHDEFEKETSTYRMSGDGWPGILSGLKTLLETGKSLNYQPMQ